jgi:acyl-coenzyme A synthetase/AMP-(fatty) acid ligase
VSFAAPEAFSIADYFLDDRVREGRGDRTALVCGERRLTYREVQTLANRFAHVFTSLGVEPEQRVLIALPDSPEYVGALFGAFKVGTVAVMANPALKAPEIGYFLDYTRSRLAVVHADEVEPWAVAARGGRWLKRLLVVGGDPAGHASWEAEASGAPDHFDNVPTHRDDPCLWLFSGGTTGRPKAVVQSHRSYANTTELYAKATLRYSESDVTLSVPKLYFGYATGSNLFFPFAVGGTSRSGATGPPSSSTCRPS